MQGPEDGILLGPTVPAIFHDNLVMLGTSRVPPAMLRGTLCGNDSWIRVPV